MARAAIDPAATSRRAARPIFVLAMASLVLAATGCGAANLTTKAGVKLAKPQTLNLSLPTGNLPPGVGGDFTGTSHPQGSTSFPPGTGFIIWNLLQGHGLQVISCVVARQHPLQTFWCTSTYSLPAGQIDAVGDYDNSAGGDAGTIAVVGGTGAYVGARGTATTINDDPNYTIRLK
jgi:hypothetical protein